MALGKEFLQTSAQRNEINTKMRATPQWRQAITALGHNPDGLLKLSNEERQQLAQQLEIPADDFHIDPAGNINDYHGWRGLPTWAKVAVAGGATAATLGAAGAFSGGAGLAGAASGSAAGGATTGGTVASGGFWGGLGKTALGLGKQYLGSGASDIIGGLAEGRAKGRQAEIESLQGDDRIRAELARLGAERAKFQLEAPSARAQQSVMGDLMANVQDVRAPNIRGASTSGERVTGGIRPSALGPNARAAGAELSRLGLSNLGKDTFDVPELSKRPQANALDKLLSVAGPASAFLGAMDGRAPGVDTSFDQPSGYGASDFLTQMMQNQPLDTEVSEPPRLRSRSQARVLY